MELLQMHLKYIHGWRGGTKHTWRHANNTKRDEVKQILDLCINELSDFIIPLLKKNWL
jgi:hypothetical protein